ncbi:LysR family transcriptional regulator [Telmatospirillum sp.]|uniref:LysR family transcriptional regulator n=1 Tax=Telmatospirillum sp. TaxID=2079197 RepID=UPI002843F09C|nr:LysR family transcriptional regulator [Telmatospirillum sp.]MDR3440292.1 LysR family transcriptional regulator [Telmatospirillum sp.]
MVPNPRQIRAFLAVARVGSFTRAAAEVHLSQPALTVQIRQLEDLLGVRLFDRDKRQVHLTSAGKNLVAPLERVLVDLDAVMNTSQDLATFRRGKVSLALLPSLAASLLPHALRKFRETYPGIEVQIHDVVAEKIVQMVKAEEVDFGLGTRLTPDRAVVVEDFLNDRLCAFFPEGHPLASGDILSVQQVAAFPLILTGRNSSVRVLFERSLARDGAEIQIAGESNYMSTALGMVRAGLGVAILPASAVEAGSVSGVTFRPIRAPWLTRKIGIIRRAVSSLSPASERFVEVLRQTAKDRPLLHFTLVSAAAPTP